MRQRIIVFIVAAIVPLSSAAQQDQQLRDRDPDLASSKKLTEDLQRANFHSGPFYLFSRLRLSDAGYTEAAYVPTEDHQGGLSLTVEAPQRLYFVPRKKTMFTLELVPGYSFLADSRSDNQFNYLARGDVHFLLNHLYLDLYTSRADQLRAYVADVNRLATTKEDETGIAAEVKYSSRTSGMFTVRRRTSSFPEDRYQPQLEDRLDFNPMQLLDRSETNARVSMTHRTFPLTSLFASVEGSDYEFRFATFKNGRRLWYSGGFLYNNGRTSVRGEAGSLRLTFDDELQRDYRGVGGRLEFLRKNGRWEYGAAVGRDLGFSIFANNNYYIASTGNAAITYSATRRLMLRSNILYERDDYDTPVRGRDRQDTISFSSVGFTYRVRRLTGGLDVGWYERESTYEGDVASGIRYVVHLSLNL